MRHVSDSLAGRVAWLELEGLSCAELEAGGVSLADHDALLTLLVRGQFPDLWRDQQLPRADFYRSYLAAYVERDER